MISNSDLQKILLEDFEYKDGELYWKKPGRSRKVGNKIGCLDRHGYIHTHYRCKTYLLHRLIFLMHRGYLPSMLDHIDGNKLNNRIENLREATFFENSSNARISKRNTTGIKGVSWDKRRQKFRAVCNFNYKKYEIGSFKTLDEASKAVKKFREEHHGAFANHG